MNKATVLLATMQLDIGGAETHVVDLACHLTELGYRVLVASNGGCYVERLTACGVPHYQVPLHDNKPALLWRSVWAMRRIVRDEQVDLIHAHARIPAFVTAVMGRPKQVRFVTTAHYNFKGLWYLSRWGEKTIAVSEDIRDYLIDYFRVSPERIVVIPNGVDTDLFSPDRCSSGHGAETAESGQPWPTARIAMVSRMDGHLSEVAVNLISACEQVYDRWPLQLLIAGDGDNLGPVSARAAVCNERLGKDGRFGAGLPHGYQPHPGGQRPGGGGQQGGHGGHVLRQAGDPGGAAGVWRPAGAGPGRPVQGGQLYRPGAERCRHRAQAGGCPGGVFSKPPEWRHSTGQFLRQLVISEYSSQRMAERVAGVYEEVLNPLK